VELAFFVLFAALALAGGLGVIASHRAIHSALALLLVLSALAVLYLLLGAQFIAVLQVIVYAGAIVVLFLFVIMLLHMATGEPAARGVRPWRTGATVGAALFLTALLVAIGRPRIGAGPPGPPADFGTTEAVGRALFTRFLLPFELASVVLLVGIIAAVVLAKGALPLRVSAEMPGTAARREAEEMASPLAGR
jgi:NADH-quinone oxidoreductase subunit J